MDNLIVLAWKMLPRISTTTIQGNTRMKIKKEDLITINIFLVKIVLFLPLLDIIADCIKEISITQLTHQKSIRKDITEVVIKEYIKPNACLIEIQLKVLRIVSETDSILYSLN